MRRALIREHARERQAWEAERARLIETICELAGHPQRRDPAPSPVFVPDPDAHLDLTVFPGEHDV